MIVTLCVVIFGLEQYPEVKNVVWKQMFILAGMQAVQSIIVLYISFVTYWKKDEGHSCFNKCMPTCHYAFAVFLFVLTPVMNVAAYVFLISTHETKVLFPYFTLNLILTILLSLWFFFHLLDVFEGLKAANTSARRNFKERTGTKSSARPIIFKEDMYSLLFISLVKP